MARCMEVISAGYGQRALADGCRGPSTPAPRSTGIRAIARRMGLLAAALCFIGWSAARADQSANGRVFEFDWTNLEVGSGGNPRPLTSNNNGQMVLIYPSAPAWVTIPFNGVTNGDVASFSYQYVPAPADGGSYQYTGDMFIYYQEDPNHGNTPTRLLNDQSLPSFASPTGANYTDPTDLTHLCSLRILVDQNCNVPAALYLNAQSPISNYYSWCVGWNQDGNCIYYNSSFGSTHQDTSINDVSNPAVLESALGYVVAPVSGGMPVCTLNQNHNGWTNAGSCEEYVAGEFLVQPNTHNSMGVPDAGVSFSVGLHFATGENPFYYSGTADLTTVGNECSSTVVVSMPLDGGACTMPVYTPPPLNDQETIPLTITLTEPTSGCSTSVFTLPDGGSTFDGGCPVITNIETFISLGDHVLPQNSGSQQWGQYRGGYAWTNNYNTYQQVAPVITSTPTATTEKIDMLAWAGTGYLYSCNWNGCWASNEPAVSLAFPDGRTEMIQLPRTVSDGGPNSDQNVWTPAYRAVDGTSTGGPGSGFFPNGSYAITDGGSISGGNYATYKGQTGVISGQMDFQGCLAPGNTQNGYYVITSSMRSAGSFSFPTYYSQRWIYDTDGNVYAPNAGAGLYVPFSSSQNGAFEGVGLVGSYDSQAVAYTITKGTNQVDGGFVSQTIAYDLPNAVELQSNSPADAGVPLIGFGKLNIRIAVRNASDVPLEINNAQIYNQGTYLLADGGYGGSYHGYSYGTAEFSDTNYVLHVLAPVGTYSGSSLQVNIQGSTGQPFSNFNPIGPVTILPIAGNACVSSCVDVSNPSQSWFDDELAPVLYVDGGSLPPSGAGGYSVHAGSNINITGGVQSSSPVDVVSILAKFGATTETFSVSPAVDAGVSLDGGIEKLTKFSIPVQVACGDHNVNLDLTVSNKCGESTSLDAGTFRIIGTDNPPTSIDQTTTFVADQANSYTVTASDPDHDALTFVLVAADGGPTTGPLNADGSSHATLDPSSGLFSWNPPADPIVNGHTTNCTQPDGTSNVIGVPHHLLFTATDFCSESVQKTLTVLVDGDSAPYLAPIPSQTVAEGAAASVDLAGIDYDTATGDSITYSCTGLPAWATLDNKGRVTMMPGMTVTGTSDSQEFVAFCQATDSFGALNCAGPQELDIFVTKTGVAPVIAHLGDLTIPENQQVGFTPVITDSNGDPTILTMEMTDGDGTHYTTTHFGATLSDGSFSWVPTYLQAGVYTVLVTATKNVTDCTGASAGPAWCATTVPVKITVTNVNRAPKLDAVANQSTVELSLLSFNLVGHDLDIPVTGINASGQSYSDHLAYSPVSYVETQGSSVHAPVVGLPTGMTMTQSAANPSVATFRWTPALGQWGDYVLTLKVTDDPGLTATGVVKIHVAYFNEPPVIVADPQEQGFEGSWIHFVTAVTDPRSRPDVCTMTGLPSGSAYDTTTNQFTWLPASGTSQNSPYTVTTQCCSEAPAGADEFNKPLPAADCTTTKTQIDVLPVAHAPVLDPIPLQIVHEASLLTFTVTATDPDGTSGLTFSAASLPAGAIFNAATQVFSWTPTYTQAGQYEVTFTVSDGTLSDSKPGRIQVLNTDRPPVIATIPTVVATVDLPVSFTAHVTDPDNDWTTCSLSGAPTGVSFTPANNQGNWTPGANEVGTYQATLTCCDQPGFPESAPMCTTAPVNFVVSPAAPPGSLIIAPEGPFTVYEGDAVNFPVQATELDGGAAAPLTCSITPLPTGAVFNAIAMQFSWTTTFGQAGNYAVVATCSDGKNTGSITVKITVLKQIVDRVGGGIATAGCSQAAPTSRNLAFLPLLAMLLLWPRRKRAANIVRRSSMVSLAAAGSALLIAGCSSSTKTGSLSGVVALVGGGDQSQTLVSAVGAAAAETRTDTNGKYALSGLVEGSYALVVAAPNTLEGSLTISAQVRAGATTAVPLQTLTPVGVIAGQVSLGALTGNAGVVVSVPGTSSLAVTDDAGNYQLNLVPAGSQTVVAARAGRGSATATVAVVRGQVVQAPLLNLVGSAGGGTASIKGKVILDGQAAPQGVPVGLSGNSPSGTTTDATGAFSFTNLASGQYTVVVAIPSAAPAVQSATVQLAAGATSTLPDMHFTPLGTINGSAILLGAAASNGIAISSPGAVGIALTDVAGNYSLQGVPAGARQVTATYPGRAIGTASVVVPWDGSVTAAQMSLSPQAAGGQINGTVSISTAADAGGVKLSLAGTVGGAQVSAANGSFTFAQLPDGLYAVTAVASNTVEAQQTLSVGIQDGGVSTLPISFTGAGAIAGLVTLNGQPAAGASVYVSGGSGSAVTDSSGHYQISSLPAGQGYSLTAATAGYLSAAVSVGTVGYAQTLQAATLVLRPEGASATVSGAATVVGFGAKPGINATVDGPVVASVGTDSDGGFSLAVTPGVYELTLALPFDGGSGYEAKIPNVVALAGTNGTFFDDGSAWSLPNPIELQWGHQLTAGDNILPSDADPTTHDLAALLDSDCTVATNDIYGTCTGTPALISGGVGQRFAFNDVPTAGLGIGPRQGAGQQHSIWFLTGISLDQSIAGSGSQTGTNTATMMIGTSDGTATKIADIGLYANSGSCLKCGVINSTAYAPQVEAAGQGLVFTSVESDGTHLIYADVSSAQPRVANLGLLQMDRAAAGSSATATFYLAPNGKVVWFRSGASGDLVVGPTAARSSSAPVTDVETQVTGGIDDSTFFQFSADATTVAFVDANGCSIPLTDGQGNDAGTTQPSGCAGLWTAAADGTQLQEVIPYVLGGKLGLFSPADSSAQLLGAPAYGVDGATTFLELVVAPFVAGSQTQRILFSSEPFGGLVGGVGLYGSKIYAAFPNTDGGSFTLVGGQPTLTSSLSEISDSAIDWLVSDDGDTVFYRYAAGTDGGAAGGGTPLGARFEGSAAVATVASDGGIHQTQIVSDGTALRVAAIAVNGASIYADYSQQRKNTGKALPHGSLFQTPSAWNTKAAAVAYSSLDAAGFHLRVSTLDGTSQTEVASLGTDGGLEQLKQLEEVIAGGRGFALMSPDSNEVVWSTTGVDLNLGLAAPSAPYGLLADPSAQMIPVTAQKITTDALGFLVDGRLVGESSVPNPDGGGTEFVIGVATTGSSGVDAGTIRTGNTLISFAPLGDGVFYDGLDTNTGLLGAYRFVSGATQDELIALGVTGAAVSPDGERILVAGTAAGPSLPDTVSSGANLLIEAAASGPPARILMDFLVSQISAQSQARQSIAAQGATAAAPAQSSNVVGYYSQLNGAIWAGKSTYYGLRAGNRAPLNFQDGLYTGVVP